MASLLAWSALGIFGLGLMLAGAVASEPALFVLSALAAGLSSFVLGSGLFLRGGRASDRIVDARNTLRAGKGGKMNEYLTSEVQERARELAAAFEEAKRPDGGEFVRLRDGSPEWMKEVVRASHGDFLPDDYRYRFAMEAAAAISQAPEMAELGDLAHEFADESTSVYTAELLAWAASNLNRTGYVDAAVEEYGHDTQRGLADQLMLGQYAERREVFEMLASALAELVTAEEMNPA